MNYISLCSGIEAASAAWVPLGWIPVAFSEIEPFPCRVLKHHHPGVPNHGDFTAFDWSTYRGAVDVLIAGTPCQAFSVAGLRQSLADARGNLTLEFIRAANAIQPRYIVWENVPGVLSTSDNAFGCFLAGIVGCNEPIMAEQGWPNAGVVSGPERSACWRVLDAQYFGLAQRRKRVFIVACPRGGADPAQILLEWESLRRDTPPSREAGEGSARGVEFGSGRGGFTDLSPTLDRGAQQGPIRNQLAPAVAMRLNAGGMGRIDAESETFITHALIGLELGNLGTGGEGFDAAEAGTGRGTPLVPVAHYGFNGDTTPKYANDCALTMRAQQGGEGYGVASSLAVRRLTPQECERLQGFENNYTAIPGAADGPRYKALGNSMAVPVIEWIGKRIQATAGRLAQ